MRLTPGNLDNPGDGYGTFEDAKYKRQFPRGFRPIVDKAKESGIRLGIWGGSDGFGDTPEEEAAAVSFWFRSVGIIILCF